MLITDRRGEVLILSEYDNHMNRRSLNALKGEASYQGSVLFFSKREILKRKQVLEIYAFVRPSVVSGDVYVLMSREQLEELQTTKTIEDQRREQKGGLWSLFYSNVQPDLTPFFFMGSFIAPFSQLQNENFTEADFSGGNLEGIDFSGSKLKNCGFIRTNLKGAKFRGVKGEDSEFDKANLQGADLSNADFRKASFSRSILRDANLEGTDFEGAYLSGADLRGANIKGADFTDAEYDSTTKADIDLAERGAFFYDD